MTNTTRDIINRLEASIKYDVVNGTCEERAIFIIQVVVKEKWLKMVSESEDAVENFNEFLDDKAILWAASRIKELEKELSAALSDTPSKQKKSPHG